MGGNDAVGCLLGHVPHRVALVAVAVEGDAALLGDQRREEAGGGNVREKLSRAGNLAIGRPRVAQRDRRLQLAR
jgi:hypothetical protein